MAGLLVTGATGLVGSNACQVARERGERVRALVRPGSDAAELEALGVELVRGDLLDATALAEALEGCDRVLHGAAVIGGTWATATAEEYARTNHAGTVAVLDAAAAVPGVRVCVLATTAFLERGAGVPIDERTPVAAPRDGEMAYVTTKRAAFAAAMERAAAGQPVTAVFPGGVYGPAPVAGRALAETSFNAALVKALRGELVRYPPVKLGWVTGEDVARVALAALAHGRPGERFLAMGRREDAMTIPEFLTLGCRLADVDHEVAATGSVEDEPELLEEFGAMARTAGTRWPDPLFDDRATTDRLGTAALPVRAGLEQTLRWLADHAPAALTIQSTGR
jgi:nucleoside-diphosphate-sugar epimerase